MNLFGRRVAIEFTPGLRIEGLRVTFRVEHTAERAPSKATVEIYNAQQTTRAAISNPESTMRLFVGYNPVPRLVFAGKPVRGGVQLQTKGADKVLRIDATDGGRAFAETTLLLTYVAGTPVTRLITDILANTGWAAGFIAPITDLFTQAATFVGRPAEILDVLAARVSADWFVRDGALYIVPRGESTPETALIISAEQGNLIGVPVATQEGVRCRTLIDATLRPHRRIVLRSNEVPNGQYIVRDAVFTGDSGWHASYYVDLVCRPVGAA